jgi:hypothetical protein
MLPVIRVMQERKIPCKWIIRMPNKTAVSLLSGPHLSKAPEIYFDNLIFLLIRIAAYEEKVKTYCDHEGCPVLRHPARVLYPPRFASKIYNAGDTWLSTKKTQA